MIMANNNNFIFPHQNDPLLNFDSDESIRQLEMYRQQLIANKQKLDQSKAVIQEPNSWDETERELSSLTDEQKMELMQDEQFIEVNNSIQALLQELLNNMLKPEMLNHENGKKLLQDRLDIVKTLKKKVVKESNKRMDLFKEYTEKYSNMSWDEFLKIKST